MTARYIIIEDEALARDEIARMIGRARPGYQLVGCAASIAEAVSLLNGNLSPDLAFVDIRLSDGLSFEIFSAIDTDVPVIFTTAYDEYAIKAFKVNSIDYLLKPVDETELSAALDKFERLGTKIDYQQLEADYLCNAPKPRFLIQMGDTYASVNTADIAYFISEDKYTFIVLPSGKRHIIGYSLDQLEKMLDRERFHRVSRGCIASVGSIQTVTKHFAGRLKVALAPKYEQAVVVSRSRAADFLKWLDGR